MNKLTKLLAVGASSCLLYTTPVVAQDDDGAFVMEEIIITGRKREETLLDVPVSASVFTSTAIADAGIDELNDLFSLIPGLHYDEDGDRLGALPSIRGVQSNEISSNRTKVTAFVDGMPVLGSQGSIGFNSFQQVEVYRGPQSAAFGRSTFAGAINYISKDPTEDFEASVSLDVSDFGEQVIFGSISGPITDKLGYILQFETEDSDSPSRYHATGDVNQFIPGSNFNASDGTEYNSQTGDNFSAKFVFEPTDNLSFDLSYGHVETHDQANATFLLTQEARDECFEGSGILAEGDMDGIFLRGELDCDWDSTRPNFAQHDYISYLQSNPALLQSLIDNAVLAGATPGEFGGRTLSVEEQILTVAQGYSVPDSDIGTISERDRVTLQSDILFDSGHALQVSLMYNEETQNRLNANTILFYDPDNVGLFQDGQVSNMAPGVGLTWDDTEERWEWQNGMGGPMTIAASPVEIEEQYVEARWVSPGEDRLRYVVGASYYDYDYLEENYANSAMNALGLGYGALLYGIVPEFSDLTGLPFEPDESILSEKATNSAVFFNVGYDLTDQLTLSVEGRYQRDEITGEGIIESAEGGKNSASVTTNSFLPRVALNYNLNDDTSLYLQWSKGVNPAGINIDLLDDDLITTLTEGVPNALIPYNVANDVDVLDNTTGDPLVGGDNLIDSYDPATGLWSIPGAVFLDESLGANSFLSYQEEELTNIEVGFKGNLLDGRLTYAGAVFWMDWEDQLQEADVSWDSPCADGQLAGVFDDVDGTPICTLTAELFPDIAGDYFYVDPDGNAEANNVGINFGDIEIKGIELEATYEVTDNWSVRGSASLLDAKYKDYCDVGITEFGIEDEQRYVDALGLVIVEPTDESVVQSACLSADGNTVAEQPKVTWSLSPTYRVDVFDGLRLQIRADVSGEGKQYLTSQNFSEIPSVIIGNLSVGLSDQNWSMTAYVENILDENTPTRFATGGDNTDSINGLGVNPETFLNDFTGESVDVVRSNYNFQPRRPRTIGLRATYNF